jgi:hypothetical protein
MSGDEPKRESGEIVERRESSGGGVLARASAALRKTSVIDKLKAGGQDKKKDAGMPRHQYRL